MSDLEADSSPVSDDRDVADGSEDLSEEYETTAETNAENEEELQLSRQIENVNRLIAECKHREIICLDLSRCGIRTLPDELLDLRHLEYLYLEGNRISQLPENFFECFSNLKWLDLRRNCLTSIPSFFLGGMTELRSLLLEGNELSTLPLELGLVKTLDGLNIRGNPLVFPPEEVMEKGVKTILGFLRTMLDAKSSGCNLPDVKDLLQKTISDADDSEGELQKGRNGAHVSNSSRSIRKIGRTRSIESEMFGSRQPSAGILRPSNADDRNNGRLKKSSSKRVVKTQSEKYLDPDGERPVLDDEVNSRFLEERQLARLKKLKMKQDGVIQGRKDQETVKNWREEAKQLQQKKNMEKRIKGKIDYDEPVTKAPFGISDNDLKVMSNEERLALDPNKKREAPKPMSPDEILRLEEVKRQQERILVSKIKEHTKSMLERRLNPLENPQLEMEAAMRDFEIAGKLQEEIEMRRKELEYRFTAHPTINVRPQGTLGDDKKY